MYLLTKGFFGNYEELVKFSCHELLNTARYLSLLAFTENFFSIVCTPAFPIRSLKAWSFVRALRALSHCSLVVTRKPFLSFSMIVKLAPKALATVGIPSDIYCNALPPPLPYIHGSSGNG